MKKATAYADAVRRDEQIAYTGTEPKHPRAGKGFDLTNDNGSVVTLLDRPDLMRMNGIDPATALASWRKTGDAEAERRGGVIFCGETRGGETMTRHYRKATWWRRVWFAVAGAREERQKRV